MDCIIIKIKWFEINNKGSGKMNFHYGQSKRKHLIEHYDGIPLLAIHTFENKDIICN